MFTARARAPRIISLDFGAVVVVVVVVVVDGHARFQRVPRVVSQRFQLDEEDLSLRWDVGVCVPAKQRKRGRFIITSRLLER